MRHIFIQINLNKGTTFSFLINQISTRNHLMFFCEKAAKIRFIFKINCRQN